MDLDLSNPANVGGRIRYLRTSKKMSQQTLADKAGVTQSAISQAEGGATNAPAAETLLRIAAALEANPWWLVTGEGEPEGSVKDADASEMLEVFAQLKDAGQRRAILAAAKAMIDADKTEEQPKLTGWQILPKE